MAWQVGYGMKRCKQRVYECLFLNRARLEAAAQDFVSFVDGWSGRMQSGSTKPASRNL